MHTLLPLKIQMVGPKCEGLVLGRALLARMLCSELALHPPAGALSLFCFVDMTNTGTSPAPSPHPSPPPPPHTHTHTLSVSCTYFHKLSNKIFHFKTLLTLPYPPPPPIKYGTGVYYCTTVTGTSGRTAGNCRWSVGRRMKREKRTVSLSGFLHFFSPLHFFSLYSPRM